MVEVEVPDSAPLRNILSFSWILKPSLDLIKFWGNLELTGWNSLSAGDAPSADKSMNVSERVASSHVDKNQPTSTSCQSYHHKKMKLALLATSAASTAPAHDPNTPKAPNDIEKFLALRKQVSKILKSLFYPCNVWSWCAYGGIKLTPLWYLAMWGEVLVT